jgi:hypothetical protein
MISITKIISLTSFILYLCLSGVAHADTDTRLERKTIKGDLVRIVSGEYLVSIEYTVKDKDCKEVRLYADETTQMMGQLKEGDLVEAKITDKNYALSIRSIP